MSHSSDSTFVLPLNMVTEGDVMSQNDDGKSDKPSTHQPTTKPEESAKPKPSPKFPPEIKTIGHGGGGVRTYVERPKLPSEPDHGGGSIRPEKTDVDE